MSDYAEAHRRIRSQLEHRITQEEVREGIIATIVALKAGRTLTAKEILIGMMDRIDRYGEPI